MKKLILLIAALPLYLFSFSYSNQDIDTAIYNLCKEIMVRTPGEFSQENYAELAYLKRNYSLSGLKLNDSAYIKSIFSNYYYDQFYLYSKFLKEDAIVTEDCLHIPESTEKDVHKVNKLLFYVLYPNSIKMPSNIVDLIDEYSSADEFWGPYKMLTTIYYLKKYNYQNLSPTQKTKLQTVENRLSGQLYKKYIESQPWSFYRLMSFKVLKMNKNESVKDIDISELIQYYKENKQLFYFEGDRKYTESLGQIGGKRILEYNGCALLWIFLLEIK